MQEVGCHRESDRRHHGPHPDSGTTLGGRDAEKTSCTCKVVVSCGERAALDGVGSSPRDREIESSHQGGGPLEEHKNPPRSDDANPRDQDAGDESAIQGSDGDELTAPGVDDDHNVQGSDGGESEAVDQGHGSEKGWDSCL